MIFTNLKHLIADNYELKIEEALVYFCANKTKLYTHSNTAYSINKFSSISVQSNFLMNDPLFLWHSHCKFIDIHIILQGQGIAETADIDQLTILKKYHTKSDMIFYSGDAQSLIKMYKDDILICYPEDAHHFLNHYISENVKICTLKVAI